MNKPTIFLLLFLLIVSCQKKKDKIDFKNKLSGKTFEDINNPYFPRDFEFKDSTFIAYQFKRRHGNYKFIEKGDSTFIIIDDQLGYISENSDGDFDLLIIGKTIDDTLRLKQKKPKWSSEKIYGEWIVKSNKKSEQSSEMSYLLEPNKISYSRNGLEIESEIEISKTHDYVNMELVHSDKKTECLWRIISLTNNKMIIDKSTISGEYSFSTENNIELTKKR
ncbi:hypothetical protein [Lacinutrix sp. Bg11-31]|uniref:hypothetical protein n=1 Tax=Lacinutrix sp. Bg11-31 TaxID=2057808 RepID=UPI000C305EE0|nr:hypothetical protein [Lacinutrix sp. Bg11-31]AUC80899.1 hypothetical protein CW733_01615 [Lacinutrix sp. Bg11-31]